VEKACEEDEDDVMDILDILEKIQHTDVDKSYVPARICAYQKST